MFKPVPLTLLDNRALWALYYRQNPFSGPSEVMGKLQPAPEVLTGQPLYNAKGAPLAQPSKEATQAHEPVFDFESYNGFKKR